MRPTADRLARMSDREFRRFLRSSGFEVAQPGWSQRAWPWVRDFLGLVWIIGVILFVFVAATLR